MRRLLKRTDFATLPLAVNDLIANTIGLVSNDALLHRVTIKFVPAGALPVVHADLVQIQQVILNLLTNAITAAGSGGSSGRLVRVWTSSSAAPYVEIAIHDSGAGIAEDDLQRIFDPFFSTKPDGLGMGLAISRTIVEAHGGHLTAENDPEGGATSGCACARTGHTSCEEHFPRGPMAEGPIVERSCRWCTRARKELHHAKPSLVVPGCACSAPPVRLCDRRRVGHLEGASLALRVQQPPDVLDAQRRVQTGPCHPCGRRDGARPGWWGKPITVDQAQIIER
jgi:hypothetical protein